MNGFFRSLCSFFWGRCFVARGFVAFIFFSTPCYVSAATINDWTINPQINYQAKLLDSSGVPVADGNYSVKISLYTAATGGTRLWTATGTVSVPTALTVAAVDGLFTLKLGDTSASGGWQNALDHTINWNSASLYLGVSVGSDSEMTPRKRLTSVPQAYNAQMLQGMYASGTAFNSDALFTVNQTHAGNATSTRTALRVSSQGTSDTFDYLIQAVNSSSTTVFQVARTGNITLSGTASAQASSTNPLFYAFNIGEKVMGSTWATYANRSLVGPSSMSTGTNNYSMVINYEGSNSHGLCLDDIETGATCPSTTGSSIQADGAISASAFDLAERYQVVGSVEPGDVLVIDPTNPLHVKKSPGTTYDRSLVGIASTRPGLLLGWTGDASLALAGRVPTKISPHNGSIAIGDPLTTSPYPGIAMKATKPGMIVGYALESASATGTIEVFVKVGFDAGSLLRTNGGEALVTDDLVMDARASASASQTTVDSWGLTFRGNRWDGSQSLNQDLTLFQDVLTATTSALVLKSGTSTLWSVDQRGNSQLAGDLVIGGRFFPATRGGSQSEKYLFLDDQAGLTSTYIATNADGWQANDSYDFAERYYSPDELQPGDLVVISQRGRLHVQRSLDEKQMLLGIVSTKPAFVAGAPAPSTYPIALAGRVPTKVSTLKGKIQVGDLLSASTIPGVAVKATQAGPVIGQALEAYEGSEVASVEVFVNPLWWGGVEKEAAKVEVNTVQTIVQKDGISYRGLARIMPNGQRVHVSFPSLSSYPLVQVTPQGDVGDGWWTDNYNQDSFDIFLKAPVFHPVTFSWRVEPTEGENNKMFLSDGTAMEFNRMTGQLMPTQEQPETKASTDAIIQASSSTAVATAPTSTSSAIEASPQSAVTSTDASIATSSTSAETPSETSLDQGTVASEVISVSDPVPSVVQPPPVPASTE